MSEGRLRSVFPAVEVPQHQQVIMAERAFLTGSNDGVFEKLLDLLDGGGGQFPLNALGAFDDRLHLCQSLLSGRQRLLAATELLVREVAGEGRAGAADAEPPSFEAVVPIYQNESKGRVRYTLSFYQDGRREGKVFNSLEDAKREALFVAQRIQVGSRNGGRWMMWRPEFIGLKSQSPIG